MSKLSTTNEPDDENKPRKRTKAGAAKAAKRRIINRTSVTRADWEADWKKRADYIRDLMKAGNLESLKIRPMSWGPITVMEKNDQNHFVHVFMPKDFTEEQKARIQAFVLSDGLAEAQSCAKDKKGVCAVEDRAPLVCNICEDQEFLQQYAPEAEHSEPKTGQRPKR